MNMGPRILAAIGRICISLIFIIIGCASIVNWQVSEVDLANALARWQGYTGFGDQVGNFFGTIVSMIPVFLGLGIALQIIGGVFLFFGFQVRLGAFFLFLYLLPTTILYHHFWFLQGHEQSLELILFLKNLAVIGGLITILALGKGRKRRSNSIDIDD